MTEPIALAPPLAEVSLPARNVTALLRRNGLNASFRDRPALRFGDEVWSHGQLLHESERFAALYRARLDPDRPPHVAALLDNTPDYVFALCGAGLVGATLVGLNHTHREEHLARDISHTDVQILITEPRHQALLGPVADALDLPGGILVSRRFADADDPPPSLGESLDRELANIRAVDGATAGNSNGRIVNPTSCGRCCSPRAHRPLPRPFAARSADS